MIYWEISMEASMMMSSLMFQMILHQSQPVSSSLRHSLCSQWWRCVKLQTLTELSDQCLGSLPRFDSINRVLKNLILFDTQLFIMLADYHGCSIPVAFGWLPSKETVSYSTFLLLLLLTFRKNEEAIKSLLGKTGPTRLEIRIKKIKCDFELRYWNYFENC